jgi:ribose transport system permease protein
MDLKLLLKNKLSQGDFAQLLSCIIALLILFLFFSIVSPFFLSANNLFTMMMQTTTTMIIGIGTTFVIVAGAIDLSVGPVLAMCSVIVASMLANNSPIWFCCLTGLVFGLILGFINGILVTKMRLPPFVATIGSQMAIRGLALVITDSRAVYISKRPEFRLLAQGRLFNLIQYPILVVVVLAAGSAFILRKTVIGRHVYAIGSNEEAARLSGLHTHRIRIFTYVFCAAMASIAGILVTSRVNSGQPSIGVMYEADAIAACVIGGASMSGGHGGIIGTILGALIIGTLSNGLNLINISTNWQTVATGVVLIIAVFLDILRQKRRMAV